MKPAQRAERLRDTGQHKETEKVSGWDKVRLPASNPTTSSVIARRGAITRRPRNHDNRPVMARGEQVSKCFDCPGNRRPPGIRSFVRKVVCRIEGALNTLAEKSGRNFLFVINYSLLKKGWDVKISHYPSLRLNLDERMF